MSKTAIRKGIEQLRKRLNESPRVWKFRGRRVVPASRWDPGDWSQFPNEYHIAVDLWLHPPADWWTDFKALMTKLQDPRAGARLCQDCAIYQAHSAKEYIEQYSWDDRGGEEALERFYQTCDPAEVKEFRQDDGMRRTKFRLYNETAGAHNRTCDVKNYWRCPYGKERGKLREEGYRAEKLWKIVDWYDEYWNPNHGIIPAESERKWYHRTEPSIIDVTNLEDILKAVDDGRIDKIKQEKERYEKQHPR